MSISKRQFDLLQAMGITVWQRRELSVQTAEFIQPVDFKTEQEPTQQETATKIIEINLKALLSQQLFTDVIHCLGANRADLSVHNNQVDLGIINWQFTQNEQIEFSHNCLKSPNLSTLANSPALKKQLWQSIGALSL